MSTKEVDQRVVEMRFDNKSFEKNVSTTMSTIDKLKQKLNFKGAVKGIDDVSSAAKKVDMSGLDNAVEKLTAKFSALDVIGVTALSNITNSALNAGKKLVKSLSVDNISAGWKKFGEETISVGTLKAQGYDLKTIETQLERLNWFTDETSYNLVDMIDNASKFTATGKGLTESVTAVMGIADWAAVTGKNASEASRAMYQLSQAMGAGVMRKEDYKSIQTLNMNTEEFQNKALEAGVALKTLKKNADGTYTSLMTKNAKAFKESQFAEHLTSDLWFTSDVMMKVFTDYSKAVDQIREYAEKNGVTASEAIEALGDSVDSFSLKAFKAGQEARTWADVISSVKDAVSTGWKDTFKYVFGNYEEATKLFTYLANSLYDIFAESGNIRNRILESGLSKTFSSLTKTFDNVTAPVKKVTKALKDLSDVVDKVINGDYGTKGGSLDRVEALTKAGYNYYEVQNEVNKKLNISARYSDELVEKQNKLLGITKKETSAKKNASKIDTKRIIELTKLSDLELKNLGYSKKQIKSIREITTQAEKLGIPIKEFIKNIDKINGRWALVDGFKNIGESIMSVVYTVRDSFENVFPAKEISAKIYDITAGFHKITESMVLSETGAEKLKRTFDGLFSLAKVVGKVIAAPFKLVYGMLQKIFGKSDIDILEFTAKIGDVLVKFEKWVDDNDLLNKALEGLITIVDKSTTAVKNFAKSLSEVEAIQNAIVGLVNLFKTSFEKIKGSFDQFKTNIPEDVMTGFSSGLLGNATDVINTILSLANKFIESFKKAFEIHSPSKVMIGIGAFLMLGLSIGISEGFDGIWEVIKKFGSGFKKNLISLADNIDFGKIFAISFSVGMLYTLNNFSNALGKLVSPLDKINGLISSVSGGITKFFNGMEKKLKAEAFKDDADGVLKIASSIALLAGSLWLISKIPKEDLVRSGIVLGGLIVTIGILALALNKLNKIGGVRDLTWPILALGLTLVLFSRSIAALGKTIKMLGEMDRNKLNQGMLGLLEFVGIIALLGIVTKIAGKSIQASVKTLVGLSVAMIALLFVFNLVSKIKPNELYNGSLAMIVFGSIVAGLLFAVRLAGGASQVDRIGSTIIKVGAAIALLAIVAKLLSTMTTDELEKGVGCVAILSAIIVGLIASTRLASKDELANIGKVIFGVGAAIALLAISAKIMSRMTIQEMAKGLGCVVILGGVIAALIASTKVGGNGLKGVAGTLLAAAMAIGILAGICVVVGMLDKETLIRGVAVVTVLGLLMAAMIAATKDAKDCKNNLVVMAAAIAVMVGSIIALAYLKDFEAIEVATKAMASLMAMFSLMVYASKNAEKIKPMSLLSIALVVAAFAGILYGMSALQVQNAIPNAIALGVLMLAMTYVLDRLNGIANGNVKDAYKAALILTSLAIPMLAFSVVLAGMSHTNTEKAINNAIALSLLMLAMTYVLDRLNRVADGNVKDAYKAALILSSLAIPLFVFSVVLAGMSHTNTENAIPNAIAIGSLAYAMTFVLKELCAVTKECKPLDALKGIGLLTAMAVPLGAFAFVISKFPDIGSQYKSILALSAIMTAMTLLLIPLAAVGELEWSGLIGVGLLLAMVVPLWAFAGSLAKMPNVAPSYQNIIALIGVMTAMTLLLIPLSLIGVVGFTAVKGVIALTALALPLFFFVGILSKMDSVESAFRNASVLSTFAKSMVSLLGTLSLVGILAISSIAGVIALTALAVPLFIFIGALAVMQHIQNANSNMLVITTLMTIMADVLVKISLLGPLALIGIVSIGALSALMIAFGALATTIGEITTLFPSLENFLDKGIGILEKLANGLGSVLGNLIGGVLGGISSSLPVFGKNLSSFFKNAMLFIFGVSTIPKDFLEKTGSLVGAVALITAASFIEGIAALLGGHALSLSRFGAELGLFMTRATPFIIGMRMIKPSLAESVSNLAKAILILTGTELLDRLTSWIGGKANFANIAEQMVFIGSGVAAFAEAVNGIDSETVETGAKAAKAIAELMKALPTEGGLKGWLLGDIDLSGFSVALPMLGIGIALFASSVENAPIKGINNKIKATKSVVDMIKAIPTEGGWKGKILGDINLSSFIDNLPKLGEGITAFANSVKDAPTDNIEPAIEATKSVIQMIKELPTEGGWKGKLLGDINLDDFATNLSKLGGGVKSFITEAGTDISADKVSIIISALNPITDLIKSMPKKISERTLDSLGNEFSYFSTRLNEGFTQIGSITKESEESLVSIIESIKKISEIDVANVSNAAKVINELSKSIEGLSKVQTKSTDEFTNSLASVADDSTNAIVAGLESGREKIEDAAESIVFSFTKSFKDADVKPAAKTFVDNLAKGLNPVKLNKSSDKMYSTGYSMANKIVSGIKDTRTDMKNAGIYLAEGLIEGINSKSDDVEQAAFNLGLTAVNGEKKGQDSNSPSKATIKAGKWFGEGLIIGIDDMSKTVYRTARNLGDLAVKSLSTTISNIDSIFDEDVNVNPTIRPVVDLTGVRSGASEISSLLNGGYITSASITANRINDSVSRNQNRSNNDLIKAVNGLKDSIGNTSGDTYYIDGITYDDGSNVSSAVETLIRAARIERRV